LPEIEAFRLNRDKREDSLSVNWVEYFDFCMVLDTRDQREVAVAKVRYVMQYDLDVRGAFAFFVLDEVKRAVEAGGGSRPYVEHDPKPAQPASSRRPARGPDPSHALVFGFPDDDLEVGVQLRAMATLDPDLKLFPGVTSSSG
jgi:hypothetical protein